MDSRGLTAVLNTPDRFAMELEQERVESLEAIKSSGLSPHIK